MLCRVIHERLLSWISLCLYKLCLIFSDSYIALADKTTADALLAILELNTKSSIDKSVMDTKGDLDDLYLQNVKSNAKKELLAYSKTFPFDSSILTTVDGITCLQNTPDYVRFDYNGTIK